MIHHVTSFSVLPDKERLEFEYDVPSKCPLCQTTYTLKPVSVMHYVRDRYFDTFALFHCPVCNDAFIEKAMFIPSLGENMDKALSMLYPNDSATTAFPEHILQISPQFVEIYHQAEKAEKEGLVDICGMAYRKALEFLVKDYLLSIKAADETSIIASSLGQCINNYINHPKIKSLAKYSSWIGNDESHYYRHHEDRSYLDLKRYITSIIYYIESESNLSEVESLLSED